MWLIEPPTPPAPARCSLRLNRTFKPFARLEVKPTHTRPGETLMTQYVLDNTAAETEQRFASLEYCYDPVTIRQLEADRDRDRLAVSRGRRWRWLDRPVARGPDRARPEAWSSPTSTRAGSTPTGPTSRCDGTTSSADELEPGAFDLAHERLVLCHLPERRRALERMIGALKPGGWLRGRGLRRRAGSRSRPTATRPTPGCSQRSWTRSGRSSSRQASSRTSGAACARCSVRRD